MRRDETARQVSAKGRKHVLDAGCRSWRSQVRAAAVQCRHQSAEALLQVDEADEKPPQSPAKPRCFAKIGDQIRRCQIEVHSEKEGAHGRRKIGAHEAMCSGFEALAKLLAFRGLVYPAQDDALELVAPHPFDRIRVPARLRGADDKTAEERHHTGSKSTVRRTAKPAAKTVRCGPP